MICRGCNNDLPTASFHKQKTAPTGVAYRCKKCTHRSYRRRWEATPIEVRKARAHAAYLRKRERNVEQVRAWARESQRRLKEKDPEGYKLRASVARKRPKNTEQVKRIRAAQARYRAAHPEKDKENVDRRRAKKLGAAGRGWTEADVTERLAEQRGKCALCRCRLGKRFHRDHIVPLARGGEHDRRNLQLLCVSCNSRKGGKDPIDYSQSIGLLL